MPATTDQILKLILEVHTTVQSLNRKVDSFGQKLETHLQEDAAWQAKLLKKIPPLVDAASKDTSVKPNGKLNGKTRRKTS